MSNTPQKPAQAAPATHWASIGEAGAMAGMRFLLACFAVGGRPLFKVVLLPVITYFFLFRHAARRASMAYLKRLQHEGSLPKHNLYRQSFSHFWQFANAIIDKFAVWQNKIDISTLNIVGDELITQLHAQQRGAVLVISHLGNFEICRYFSSRHPGSRITVLMHTHHAVKFNALMKEKAKGSQVDIVQVTHITPATAMMLNERYERGEFIAIAGDRVAVNHPQNCLMAPFLGAKAPFPMGPFTLAAILQAPLISLFCVREAKGYRIEFQPLSAGVKFTRKERQQGLQTLAQHYAQQLANQCRKQPLQWFNFFDFWQQPVDATKAPNPVLSTATDTPRDRS